MKKILWITTLGLLLRIAYLSHHDIWFDESISILIARFPLSKLLSAASFDNNPPLYYLLLHFWMKISSHHLWLRTLSLIFSTATIPATYALARIFTKPRIASFAALLTAVMPVQLYFAGEIRFYSLLILLSTYLFYLAVRKKQSSREEGYAFLRRTLARLPAWLASRSKVSTSKPNLRERKNVVLLRNNTHLSKLIPDLSILSIILITTSLLLTHYYGFLITAAVVFLLTKRSNKKKKLWLISMLVGVALVIPWIVFSFGNPHPHPWVPNPFLSMAFMPIAATTGLVGIASPTTLLKLPFFSLVLILSLSALATWLVIRTLSTTVLKKVLAVTGGLLLVSFTVPLFNPRLILPFTPLIYIALAKSVIKKPKAMNLLLALVSITTIISFTLPFRGPRVSQAVELARVQQKPVFHTAISTFYPALVTTSMPNYYIGASTLPKQLTHYIGGTPLPLSKVIKHDRLVILIDEKNTDANLIKDIKETLTKTHHLSVERTIDNFLLQTYTTSNKLFAISH